MIRWTILTGEYPPDPGGVSDYTRLVACALAHAGDEVHVFAPPRREESVADANDPGVMVQRLPGRFGPRSLVHLEGILAKRPRPDQILVQYVPHAFGLKAMNLPFAAWVASRLHRIAPVWVMFHEVAFPLRKWPVPHVLLGVMTRVMARLIAHASDRVFVSIPVWGTLLSAIAPRSKPAEWLPIPCSVEAASDSATIAAVRDRFAPPRGGLVGHFGTFGKLIGDLLESATVALLRLVPEAAMLFIGRGSDSFRDRFATAHSEFATRVHASGRLAASAISAHLLACDLVIQPYPDGISTRRTSAMAALANGVATVTNLGPLSERLWPADAVIAAPTPDPIAIAHLAAELLADPARRSTLSRSAASLYQRGFALGKTISRLRDNVL